MLFCELCHRHSCIWFWGIFDLAKLVYVNKSIHECSCTEWSWHWMSRRIVGLSEPILSLSSHHFLDNNLSQSFFPELSVDSQEVDFSHLHCLSVNLNSFWASYYRCHDFLVLWVQHQKVKVFDEPRIANAPPELLLGISKSEIALCIFDVMVHQEFTNFINFVIIFGIESVPLETRWQRSGLIWNIFWFVFFYLTLLLVFKWLLDCLRVPELVLPKNGVQMSEFVSGLEMCFFVFRLLLELLHHLSVGEIIILLADAHLLQSLNNLPRELVFLNVCLILLRRVLLTFLFFFLLWLVLRLVLWLCRIHFVMFLTIYL